MTGVGCGGVSAQVSKRRVLDVMLRWVPVGVSLVLLCDEEESPHPETISVSAGPQVLAGDSALISKSLGFETQIHGRDLNCSVFSL